MTTTLKIEGMHCASCKTLIEEVCSEIAGIKSCVVDVAAGSAVIDHESTADMADVVKKINEIGDYRASII